VATWDDVRQVALDLPGTVEEDGPTSTSWRVGSKAFCWERHLRPIERQRLTDPPDGPALGLRVADPGVAHALAATRPDLWLVVAGYGVHPMALLHVERASFDDVDEAVTDAWLCRAPKKLRDAFLAGR
jgi:hypothetical protein